VPEFPLDEVRRQSPVQIFDHCGVEAFAFVPLPPDCRHRCQSLRRRHVRFARLKPRCRLPVPGAPPDPSNDLLVDPVDFLADFL